MSKKVIVLGSHGRMGSLAIETIQKDKRFILAGGLDKEDDIEEVLDETDVDIVVDFTLPSSVFQNAKKVLSRKKHLIIGATGLTKTQIDWLSNYCKEKVLGCAIIPNFSIACALMIRASRMVAAYMSDVEIIEYHHSNKKDAPSGTAKHTAQLIQAQHNLSFPDLRREKSIPIHSIRNDGFVANQEVIFGQAGESLILQHTTNNRSAFMPGLLLVCEKIGTYQSLVVGLENMLPWDKQF